MGGPAAGGGGGETAPAYGLTVSGPGLVPYVDPAFRVDGGHGAGSGGDRGCGLALPRAKVASGGILGDVDNTGRVDFFDALLVALYSRDSQHRHAQRRRYLSGRRQRRRSGRPVRRLD